MCRYLGLFFLITFRDEAHQHVRFKFSLISFTQLFKVITSLKSYVCMYLTHCRDIFGDFSLEYHWTELLSVGHMCSPQPFLWTEREAATFSTNYLWKCSSTCNDIYILCVTFVTVIKENYRISGWLFLFICSVAVVWLSGRCHYSSKEGRIMGRHSARSRVTDCGVSTTGTLIVITCVAFLLFFV